MSHYSSTEENKVRVLAIDGGGIRGIIPAALLAEIERRTGRPVSRLFDLMAGTSTGGILVLALAKPQKEGCRAPAHSAEEMVEFYDRLGPKIFSKPLLHRLTSGDGLVRSRYPDGPIESVLINFFGEVRLKDALTPLFIPSYELRRRTPFFFRSIMASQDASYDYPMHTVARSTSAAPTYFPPEVVAVSGTNDKFILIDGGVFANNPAACAFVEAKVQFPKATEFTVVSLGTGAAQETPLMTGAADWGIARWARPILDTVLDGVSNTVDYQLSQLLPPSQSGTERYFRIQPVINAANQAIDDVAPRNLAELKSSVAKTIAEQSREIDNICAQLT
jgi:patatin-like phospholipase/acyl hydrolase